MLRLKVVGRREEPATGIQPEMAPGAPQQTTEETKSYLLVQSVDSDDKPIQSQHGMTMIIPAENFEALSDYTTGSILELPTA